MDRDFLRALSAFISQHTGESFAAVSAERVGGGCIHRAYRVSGVVGGRRASGFRPVYFVKINDRDKLPQFVAERVGLCQLRAAADAAQAPMRIPAAPAAGLVDDSAALVLEWLELGAAASDDDWFGFGRALAALHGASAAAINQSLPAKWRLDEGVFGVKFNTATLGDLPGYVGLDDDWAESFCRRRLGFQLDLARRLRRTEFAPADETLAAARRLLSHRPPPSLTHGDLWGGNASFAALGGGKIAAAIFDPAPQLADAETDLAMSELFGGFAPGFYRGYASVRRLDAAGYRRRRDVYQLFHILNHYNLFGGGYRAQAEALMRRIVKAV